MFSPRAPCVHVRSLTKIDCVFPYRNPNITRETRPALVVGSIAYLRSFTTAATYGCTSSLFPRMAAAHVAKRTCLRLTHLIARVVKLQGLDCMYVIDQRHHRGGRHKMDNIWPTLVTFSHLLCGLGTCKMSRMLDDQSRSNQRKKKN